MPSDSWYLTARAIRAFEYALARDVGRYIAKINPDFLQFDPDSEFQVPCTMVFRPSNPINPHVDYIGEHVLTSHSVIPLPGQESLQAEMRIWNISNHANAIDSGSVFLKNPDSSGSRKFLSGCRHDSFETSSFESFPIPPCQDNDVQLVMFCEWLVAHSAGISNTPAQRVLNAVDVRANYKYRPHDTDHINDVRIFLRRSYRSFVQGYLNRFQINELA